MISQKSKVKSQNIKSKYQSDLTHRCYKFSLDVISLIDQLPRTNSSQVIANQLLRSSTSIGANLVEAKSSSSRLEFKKFQEISLKSANETKYWLGLLRDGHFATTSSVNQLLVEVTEISNMLAAGIKKLKDNLI